MAHKADAFGNPCKSLRQVIDELEAIVAEFPHLANEPVWADSNQLLFCPIYTIGVKRREDGNLTTHVVVLRGE